MINEASSSGSSRGESVVVDVGRRRSSCGYCKSGRLSSISHGLIAHSLTVDDYQDLLDRGWRRAGTFLYKPEMETTCCPAYTIRLKADDFIPSKEQLRVSRRMQRYLDGLLDGKKRKEHVDKSSASQGCTYCGPSNSSEAESLGSNNEEKNKEEGFMHFLSEQIDNSVQSCIKSGDLPCDMQFPRGIVKKVSLAKRKLLVEGSEDLLYTSNISFQIAANLRRIKSAENDLRDPEFSECHVDGNVSSLEFSPECIAQKLASSCQHLVEIPGLIVRACDGHINFYSATRQTSLDKENQSATLLHKSPIQQCKRHDKTFDQSHGKKRKLEIHLKRSSFDPEEFALYKKYQMEVHNDTPDEVTKSSYMRFLVDTPLICVPPTGNGSVPPCGFGSFHQQYVIDGQLVAVGVIDILPKCLSSKYLFWDPDLAFLSLGKYSALQEIGWVKENQPFCPSLQYYYLGYYIHSCSKMRYKAAYCPSELLCPLRYQWVPFNVAKHLFDRTKYVVLSDFSSSQNGESSLLQEPENPMDLHHTDLDHCDSNDVRVDGDEMVDPNSEWSDDDFFPETSDLASFETEDDVSDILIGFKGDRVRFKDLLRALGPDGKSYLEDQLSRYMKVVGAPLSERMVYMLS